jgi:hypothetical protein
MKKLILLASLICSSAFGWGGLTTYLPSKSQKLMTASGGVYTHKGTDAQALMHFDLDLSIPCTDGGTTYHGYVTLLDAIWPFYGNVLNSQKYNFLNTTKFTLVDHGGGTYSSSGYAANGTTQYLDTGFNPSLNQTTTTWQAGPFLNEQTDRGASNGQISLGMNSGGNSTWLGPSYSARTFLGSLSGTYGGSTFSVSTTVGLWNLQYTASGYPPQVYYNGSLQSGYGGGWVYGGVGINNNVFIGAFNNAGVPVAYSPLHTDFAAYSNSIFTSLQELEFYNIITAYNTAQGR